MYSRSFSILATLSLWLIHGRALTPQEYFGGSDNDAYVAWVDERGSEYSKSKYMASTSDPANGAAFHIRLDDEYVHLAVAVKATGWVGFGIAEVGGMFGADVVLFEAIDPESVKDMHILDTRLPLMDDSQDWNLTRSQANGGFLIFEAQRLIDTGDPQDRAIVFDGDEQIVATKVIAAWGDEKQFTYHGLNRARTSVRFHDIDLLSFQERMEAQSEGFFDVLANDHLIKAEDTEYAHFCFTRSDMVSLGAADVEDLYLIGFEPIVDPRSAVHVHHFVLTASTEEFNDEDLTTNEKCEDAPFFEIVYLWAPGEGPLILPENVGARMFSTNAYNSFQLQIHYNNPEEISGVVDSSGVRFYYTTQPREYEFGVLALGDSGLNLEGFNIGTGTTEHIFDCPSACSKKMMKQNVTVISENLHMHAKGARMFNEQIRDGKVIRTGKIDYWEFYQQGAHHVQQPTFEILPGDEFRTACYYHGDEESKFGYSSQEEMCVAFLMYYPRQTTFYGPWAFPWICGYDLGVSECTSGWEVENFDTGSSLGRTFGFLNDITAVNDDSNQVEVSVGNPESDASSSTTEQSSNAWHKPLFFGTLATAMATLLVFS